MGTNWGFRTAVLIAAAGIVVGTGSVYATGLTINSSQVWSQSYAVPSCQTQPLTFDPGIGFVEISGISDECATGTQRLYVTAIVAGTPVATLAGHVIQPQDVTPGSYTWVSLDLLGLLSFAYTIA